jgi:hypothetical protein
MADAPIGQVKAKLFCLVDVITGLLLGSLFTFSFPTYCGD